MEASARLFSSSFHRSYPLKLNPKPLARPSFTFPARRRPYSLPQIKSSSSSAITSLNPTFLGFLLSLSSSHRQFNVPISSARFDCVASNSSTAKFFEWHRGGNSEGILNGGGDSVTVVLLGWLGAKQKHLKRYVDLYTSMGINAVTFVVPVREVLSFDLGRRVEERILALSREIESWISERDKDGRERSMVFHTFSNTGWLVYGAILDNLKGRQDLIQRIKGCVVDSGADPELNPKVWAAGFSAALLKKRSSSAYPSPKTGEEIDPESGSNLSSIQEKEPPITETMLLFLLEKFFSAFLKLPDVNRRLMKIISLLTKNQPQCPQLYLYSTADKVIPFQSVELFTADQRRMGRKACLFNFGSSPHVDHYRTFPDVYASELHNFLRECLATVTQS